MSGLGRLVVRRLALGLLTIWAASVVIFAATEILPGDVATAVLGPGGDARALANIREAARPRAARPRSAMSMARAIS